MPNADPIQQPPQYRQARDWDSGELVDIFIRTEDLLQMPMRDGDHWEVTQEDGKRYKIYRSDPVITGTN